MPQSGSSVTSSTAGSLTKPFGSTFTWDDGLAITVSPPQPFTPKGDVSYQDKESKGFVVMEVTFRNGTAGAKEPMLLVLRATTGTREAKRVFDMGNGVEMDPSAKVLPGREVKWRVVYGVDPGKPFVMQVDYGFDRKGGIYEG